MLRNLQSVATIVLLILINQAPAAFADTQVACPLNWRPDQVPGVASGQVLSSTTWDPDGAGPLPPRLVLGGNFLAAGNTPTVAVASWDGTDWQPMPSGFPIAETANALTVHNGDLILASNRIKRWNGAGWENLGAGLTVGAYALASFNSELIAAAPVQSMGYIARLSGGSWQPLAQGLNNSVYALTIFNGELIAGGDFTTAGGAPANRVARWNGTSWQPFGGGVNGAVRALAVYNNELIAAGYFSMADGLPALGVARWNGVSWQQLGGGLAAGTGANALTVLNNDLFIGGSFTTAAGADARYVVRWDGTQFQPLDTGTNAPIRTLTTFNGQLVVGGSFNKAGPIIAAAVATWNGSAWSRIGALSKFATNGPVTALLSAGSDLYAGGSFSTAGPISAAGIAHWNGSTWQALGAGIAGPVSALTLWNGKLIAAGSFGAAGGIGANNVARWTGTNWEPMAAGMPGSVYALAVFRGDLIAGGISLPTNGRAYAARWNGSAWESLNAPNASAVISMVNFENDLVVATDNQLGPYRWNGSSWQQLPFSGWPGGWANAMIADQGALNVAGGYIPSSGGGEYNFFSRRFAGSGWVNSLPSGTQNIFHSQAYAICNYSDALLVGVVRLNVTNNPISALVQLSGPVSYSFGTFVPSRDEFAQFLAPVGVNAMANYNGDLIVGGSFSSVAGVASPNLARFGPTTELPAVAQQPTPKKATVGGSASFTVATFGGQPQNYQWRKNGANLTDDPHIAGAQTDTVTINPAALADNGQYDCVITNACGAATSNQARLTILGQVPTLNPTQPIGPGNPG